MAYAVYSRTRVVVNTDPQRRCYNGCNFSERVDHGPWELFGEYDTEEKARQIARIFRCDRYEYKVEPM